MDQVEEIKAKADIVSIVQEHVDLKKAGSNFKGVCPFHSEKTPSFMVSPELQIFKCFGCGESGDVITFLEKQEGMEFYEALKFLADRTGVKLKEFKSGQRSEKEKLFEVNAHIAYFYNYVLTKHKAGKEALEYLLNKRKLKPETIKEFQLGFSPQQSGVLEKYLIDKKKVSQQDLEKTGVFYRRGRDLIDRFRGRVIFPLYDHRGNVAGFTGRILPGGRRDIAKYVNTPETPTYHKSDILYGLHLTRPEIKREKYAILVEGNVDVVTLWQSGFKNVVCISGTSLTSSQARMLSRFANRIVLALDMDLAGDKAARRGIGIAEEVGLEVDVVRLGKYQDPDEVVRDDPAKLRQFLRDAVSVWDFLIDSVFARYKKTTGAEKAKISKEIVPILSSIEDSIVQAHYTNIVANRLGVPVEAVAKEVSEKESPVSKSAKENVVEKETHKERRQLLEERLLALAFRSYPKRLLEKDIPEFGLPLAKRLVSEYKNLEGKMKKYRVGDFAKLLPPELQHGFADLVLREVEGVDTQDRIKIKKELELVIRELRREDLKIEISDISDKIKKYEKENNEKKLSEVTEKHRELTRALSAM